MIRFGVIYDMACGVGSVLCDIVCGVRVMRMWGAKVDLKVLNLPIFTSMIGIIEVLKIFY